MTQLPDLVQALLDPKAYPETPQQVELLQTQMSFVFISGDYVYKVKKPVDLGYLDYTTLEKRLFFCRKEVELNRRLCPDAYLGVVAITREGNNILVEGQGKPLEYAVKMRRLPQGAMMDVLLANNQVSTPMVTSLAQRLVAFHQTAMTNAEISAFGDLSNITRNTEENFTQTEKYIGNTISQDTYQRIKAYTDSFVKQNAPLFHKRIESGRIRDCHGDLHAAHICFTGNICIYDCIEFSDRFRYCDVASEIAFLAMDLDHFGRAGLSRIFVNAYVAQSGDKELRELLSFYKCYLAYVRGKVESFKYDDPYLTKAERKQSHDAASSYFDLASSYTRSKPTLFITSGLVGTGKTTIAEALAKRLGLAVISSDVTRKKMAGIPLAEHHFEEFSSGIYSADFSRKTYDSMFTEARQILGEGGSVIMDASFIKARERLEAKGLAEEAKADFFVIECILDESLIQQRLAQRLEQGTVSDGRWEIFEHQKRQCEPIAEVPASNHIIVDTSLSLEKTIPHILDKTD